MVTTFAGQSGQRGFADGVGNAARFNLPGAVATDSAGNIYVGDTENHMIRKITPAGVVSSIGGMPLQYGSADGIGSAARFFVPLGVGMGALDTLYVADSQNATIRSGTPPMRLSADFDDDGFADFLLFNPATRQTAIWKLQGSAFVGGSYGPTLPNGWAVVGAADLNHDTNPDYLVHQPSTGRTGVWRVGPPFGI